MLSLNVNTPKPPFLATPFLPKQQLRRLNPPQPPPKPFSVSALILPPSSSPSPQKQQLYQPFRPPPSPLPPRYRNLDTNARLEILTNRLGSWFEYAPLIPSLVSEGFTSSTLEELTGIPSVEQNRLVVAAQVRDSLVQLADDDTVSFFNSPASPEILYEIRTLNGPQRVAAARFIIAKGLDTGRAAEELARSIKDFPRRYGDRGWESFQGVSPGDCLAFMYYRQAQEHKSAATSPELSRAALERALEVVETVKGRRRVEEDLDGKAEEESGGVAGEVDGLVRKVPVVRMALGEVAESSVVVLLPVCCGVEEVEEAPWEVGMGGDFGVVRPERGWKQWVVLPGWAPVAGLRRGGVAVEFRDMGEEVRLVVVDRGLREVGSEGSFYLVAGAGSNGDAAGGGLRVERGAKLKEMGVEVSLGTVVLVVRPPRDEVDNQLEDDDWE
ncbi:Rubisco accumulation factor 2- chloroplastic [Striga hermonthica]|uniref:Rubisco accumulation factor 2- chloroplastic n=1 Tax=Striga hermonthica TaxID=68872 RepID=A0A9N7R038_STRHE|nr:Rubisco accumulation factor 2- chloroplastic [Striga hermonthica]